MVLLLPGVFALIPFKVSYLQMFDIPFYLTGILGALLLLRGAQRIGWRLNLEGNILYYSKFNVYSSWKKRRRTEFALPLSKVVSAEKLKTELKITYNPSKKLVFSIRGLDSLQHRRLDKIILRLNNKEIK